MSKPSDLDSVRAQIDQLDSEIQALINRRAHCAQQVAEIKLREDPSATLFYRPEREAQVLQAVKQRNQGPLDGETMARLFREIMSACLALEHPLRIAFLGPDGTFTHSAAIKHFGHAVKTQAMVSIDDVFREVAAGSADYGVVSVENSTEGVVTHTLDSFLHTSLRIIGEVELRIHHNFLISDGTRPESISRIYSHQQSLAQCRQWLDTHYPRAERVAVSSNAEAARRVKSEWHSAAIAGETAAELYGLAQLHQNIEDNPNNTTRFLIIGREFVPASGQDKCSIVVRVHNEPGALFSLLEPFHRRGINLTRIESRPSKNDVWTYVFFIDFEGHESEQQCQDVLAELESKMKEVKRLGSFPKAVI